MNNVIFFSRKQISTARKNKGVKLQADTNIGWPKKKMTQLLNPKHKDNIKDGIYDVFKYRNKAYMLNVDTISLTMV